MTRGIFGAAARESAERLDPGGVQGNEETCFRTAAGCPEIPGTLSVPAAAAHHWHDASRIP